MKLSKTVKYYRRTSKEIEELQSIFAMIFVLAYVLILGMFGYISEKVFWGGFVIVIVATLIPKYFMRYNKVTT